MRLEETMERARAAYQEKWDAEREPKERFTITFKGTYTACGEVMSAIGRFAISNVDWAHDPPWHTVVFDATFRTLKSVQGAVMCSPVLEPKCTRCGGVREGGA